MGSLVNHHRAPIRLMPHASRYQRAADAEWVILDLLL